MSLRDFIRMHRCDIDRYVHAVRGMEDYRLNGKDREEWIKNDEALYRWWGMHRRARLRK